MKKLSYSALFLIISYCISIDLFALEETTVSFVTSVTKGAPSGNITYTNIDATQKDVAVSGTVINIYSLTAGDDGHGAVTLIRTGGTYAKGTFVTLTPENATPNQPILMQPLDNATGISIVPTLQTTVSDPNPADNLDVSFYGRATGMATGADFTLVLIPDPQNESQYYPTVFTSITDWIVAQKSARNIVFVTTAGDMVNNASSTTEYSNAGAAMDKLDPARIPYSIGVGNHDQPTTNFNTYFGTSRFLGKDWYGGHNGSTNDNSYSFFSASGMEFILINLEYNPSSAVLDWADALLKVNPSRRGIVESHSIININNDWTNMGIYTALKDNPNLFLMLCGHMHSPSDGAAYRSEIGDDGHTIHIMQADYQDFPSGGNGYLRILRFSPTEDKIYASTFSPFINGSITSTTNYDQMEMVYDMEGSTVDPYTLIGTISEVTNGGTASYPWPGRAINTEYEWYVTVSDGVEMVTGSTWSFTTVNASLPSAFNVIGSGSYCQSSGGLPVGLTNSEVGVTYTLYKNTVAQTPTVAGTGAAISFGNQTAGPYNVTGTNGGGTTTMQGTAIIMENPDPMAPTVTLTQPTCGSTTGTITVTAPTGTGMTYSINGSTYTNTSGIFTAVAVGTYSVTAKNASGCTSPVTSVTLNANPAPAAPTVILTQPTCGSTTGTITVTAPTGTGMTYSINGSTYTNISGIFTAVAVGTYNVTAKNASGCTSPVTSVTLNANPAPVTPIITIDGNVLHSNATNGNQWHNESGSINGATGQDYTPLSGSNYYVIVSNGVCSSDPSNIINFILSGIGQLEISKTINLYPNPTDGKVTLSIKGENPGNIIIEILNIQGQTMKTEKMEMSEDQTEVYLEGLPKGTYFVKIIFSGNSVIRTIILQ